MDALFIPSNRIRSRHTQRQWNAQQSRVDFHVHQLRELDCNLALHTHGQLVHEVRKDCLENRVNISPVGGPRGRQASLAAPEAKGS